jgi:hypothetical protein
MGDLCLWWITPSNHWPPEKGMGYIVQHNMIERCKLYTPANDLFQSFSCPTDN